MALANRRFKLEEFALATGFFEGCEIIPAVRHRIERVVLTVEPDSPPAISPPTCAHSVVSSAGGPSTPTLERRVVHGSCGPTALAEPAADKIDDAGDLFGMQPGIGDRQHATARLPTDQNGRRGNVWPPPKHRYRRIDVAQCTIGAGKRDVGVAAISERTDTGEAFVVEPVGFAAPAALRKRHDPSAVVEEIGKIDREPGFREQARVIASPGRSMVDHGKRKRTLTH